MNDARRGNWMHCMDFTRSEGPNDRPWPGRPETPRPESQPGRIRKVSIREARVGMVVVDTGLSWTEHPFLYSGEGPLTSKEQIDDLQSQGFRELFIQDHGDAQELVTAWGRAVRDAPHLPDEGEYARASKLYDDSFDVISSFIQAARLGKPLDREAPARLVEGVIESVASNPDALVSLINLRFNDQYSYAHCINVSVLAVVFGHYLGFDRPALRRLGEAGLFHDLGKIRIPDDILDKPGRLTPEEFAVVKSHPAEGVNILRKQDMAGPDVLKMVREHHEKFNGSGYPLGLTGERLSRFVQILGIVDSYDAMTSNRPYRDAILPNTAMRILFAMRNKDFSRSLLEPFIKCLGIFPVGSPVRLRNGSVAMVCGSNPSSPLYPRVKLLMDANRKPLPHRVLDLSSPEVRALGDGFTIDTVLDMSVLGLDPCGLLF